MGRQILIAFLATLMPATAVAQDDMYFVPTKANVDKSSHDYGLPSGTYYSGSDRGIDEYNRHGSYVQQIDSAGNDIITFDAVAGVYPDSLSDGQDDYEYARRMSRFDDYSWYDPYWAGYWAGRSDWWGWYDPWFYSGWYYSPWHYGWGYDPWYWGWGGWHSSWWGYPGFIVSSGRPTGTFSHLRGTGRRPLAGYSGGRTGFGNRTTGSGLRPLSGYSGSRTGTTNRPTGNRFGNSSTGSKRYNASERFGTSRTNSSNSNVRTSTPQRSSSSFSSGSSFGGSRSGGSFSGGSRSGGGRSGGGFGGRR